MARSSFAPVLPLFDTEQVARVARPHVRAVSSEEFLESVLNFDEFGAPTRREVREGLPYLINEFWTSEQRQAHSIHEVSYRACFKPQLPQFFVERLTNP